jgi:hypothetical protein
MNGDTSDSDDEEYTILDTLRDEYPQPHMFRPTQPTLSKYIYSALTYLKNFSEDDIELLEKYTVYHCIYHINTSHLYPFLQFYLHEDFDALFGCEKRGMLKHGNVCILFYETMEPLQGSVYYLSDELSHMHIHTTDSTLSDVSLVFQLHPYCFLLEDERGQLYEIPVAGYREKPSNPAHINNQGYDYFPLDKEAILGPYYYFNVNNSLNRDQDKYVLFLGRTKVPMNFPKDGYDKSLMKQYLLKEEVGQETKEKRRNTILRFNSRQTMRISDHDGDWTRDYDSVYLGKLELDDGSILLDEPCWVLKDGSKQVRCI